MGTPWVLGKAMLLVVGLGMGLGSVCTCKGSRLPLLAKHTDPPRLDRMGKCPHSLGVGLVMGKVGVGLARESCCAGVKGGNTDSMHGRIAGES